MSAPATRRVAERLTLALTDADAKMQVFDYIDVFYNQRRRHSTNGQISPAFERRATEAA